MRIPLLLTLAAVLLAACNAERSAMTDPPPLPDTTAWVVAPVTLRWALTPTPDGSGEVTEPDVVAGWRDMPFTMIASPYPASDARLERPQLWTSRDGITWTWSDSVAHNDSVQTSDPDLLVAGDTLIALYRQNAQSDVLVTRRSTDGHSWTAAAPELTGTLFTLIGPAVIATAESWDLWVVDAYPGGCGAPGTQIIHRRRTIAGWSAPEAIAVGVPGWVPWHLDAAVVGGVWWLLYDAYPAAWYCGHGGAVFLAISADSGRTWTSEPRPLLAPGGAYRHVYRSSVVAFGDSVQLWYSGQTPLGPWRVATERVSIADVLARVH